MPLIESWFYVLLDTKLVISETFPKPISFVWYGKTEPNTTKAHIHQTKCTTTQNKHKKLKPGLVASYDIQPGNGEGLFWFQRFINLSLTYLLTAPDPHGATM